MPTADLLKLIRNMLGTGLTYEEADQIAKATVPMKAEAGTLIFSEGNGAEGLMLLASGTVEILRTTRTGRMQTVATVEAARFSALRWRVKEPTASARSRFA